MSKLLIHGDVRLFNADLADLIGLNEAIMLQQIHYWLEINEKAGRNKIDDRFWTYSTLDDWVERDFRFWSKSTVQRTLNSLKAKHLIVTANHNKLQIDRTVWYSIDYDVLKRLEIENEGMTTSDSQSDHIDESKGNPLKSSEKPPDVVSSGGMTTPCGQNDHMDQVNVSPPCGQSDHTITRDLNRDQPKSTGTGTDTDFLEETMELLNRPDLVDYMLSVSGYDPKLDLTMREMLQRNRPGATHYEFPADAMAHEAVGLIRHALTERGMPADPLHVVAVIVQAHACDGEGGRGRQIVEYMQRASCGLSLRPFVVFDGRVGDPLIDETLNSTTIPVLADYIRRRVVEGDVHAKWAPQTVNA